MKRALVLSASLLAACDTEYASCDGAYSEDLTLDVDTTGAIQISWEPGEAYVIAVWPTDTPDTEAWRVQCPSGATLDEVACISSPVTYGDDAVGPDATELSSGVEYTVFVATYTDSGDTNCGDGHTREATFTAP